MRRLPLVLFATLPFALVACGGDGDSATPAAGAAGDAPGTEAAVAIETFQFAPGKLTVKVGQTVTWTNGDSIEHTATSGTRTYDPSNSGVVTKTNRDGTFDLALAGKGTSASHTFEKAGTYHYFCDRHPGMEADITVEGS